MMTTMMEPRAAPTRGGGPDAVPRIISRVVIYGQFLGLLGEWLIWIGLPSWVRDEIFTAIGVIYATEMFIGLIYLQIELQMHNFDDQDSSLNIDVQRFEHFIVI